MSCAFPPGVFADLDVHFAALVERLAGGRGPLLALAAALVSRQRREGHLCLHLPSIAGRAIGDSPARINCPPLDDWLADLNAAQTVVGPPGALAPLILDPANRLYLQRYWAYEDRLARGLRSRAGVSELVDEGRLAACLDHLFPPGAAQPDWQRRAAETAARRRLCVITGGPGTGKTRTLVRILALLLELRADAGSALRFALAAPTGKAAARIQEEVRRAAEQLGPGPAASALLTAEANTLHRLLGARPGYASFQRNAQNPLPAEVVVVDEASMVDVALMAKLLEAVSPSARLILLGDKDQLASVEAGAVLGDICGGPASPAPARPSLPGRGPSEARPGDANSNPLADCLIELQRNYRFADDSPIHRLSVAINHGNADAALAVLGRPGAVTARPLPASDELAAALRPLLLAAWPVTLPTDPAEMLASLTGFRVLCAVREGPYGVERLNDLAARILRQAGRLGTGSPQFAGRPVMITRNDHALRLFNGDVGILLPGVEGGLRAFFPAPDGGVRSFLPARLPAHETVFAMTVHKSQGSEFTSVLLVLPERDSPVLTRELLYTGLTRARERAQLWFSEAVLRQAIARRVERHSGLQDKLWHSA
jgi:exodeoxyribonuclease V alpha subunit